MDREGIMDAKRGDIWMELRKVTGGDYKYLKHIYVNAFPPEERAPFRRVWKQAERGKADFRGIFVRERCCGFTYAVSYKDIVYFFYFAIDPRVRGRGIGTRALKEVMRRYQGKRFFLALEPLDPEAKNYEERVRRHRFYESCGLVDLPHQLSEAKVVYSLMGTGEEIHPEEYRELMDYHLGRFMRRLLDLKMIN